MHKNTGCKLCNIEQAITESRTALCDRHRLEALAETARIAKSDFQFAVLKKLIELDIRVKELGN